MWVLTLPLWKIALHVQYFYRVPDKFEISMWDDMSDADIWCLSRIFCFYFSLFISLQILWKKNQNKQEEITFRHENVFCHFFQSHVSRFVCPITNSNHKQESLVLEYCGFFFISWLQDNTTEWERWRKRSRPKHRDHERMWKGKLMDHIQQPQPAKSSSSANPTQKLDSDIDMIILRWRIWDGNVVINEIS